MSLLKTAPIPEIYYPESDGEPMAETDVHRRLMSRLIESLELFYQPTFDIYASGNLFIYYKQGDPTKRVAPDIFVVQGVPKGDRRIYKLWEEGKTPGIVIELSSRKTWREDLYTKFQLYQQLKIQEYFIFDPEYDYLPEPLVGWTLKKEIYHPLKIKKGRIHSQVLALDLVDTGETLRLFDPVTGEFLRTQEESEELLKHESEARQKVEAENARLRAELAKLQKRK